LGIFSANGRTIVLPFVNGSRAVPHPLFSLTPHFAEVKINGPSGGAFENGRGVPRFSFSQDGLSPSSYLGRCYTVRSHNALLSVCPFRMEVGRMRHTHNGSEAFECILLQVICRRYIRFKRSPSINS